MNSCMLPAFAFLLASCSQATLDRNDPRTPNFVDQVTNCPRYLHHVAGPDAYDEAHGEPYHCEKPREDPDFVDVDSVSE